MERITDKHIDFELSRLNDVMGTPQEKINADKKFNVCNIHLYDYNVVQVKNEAGGIAILARCNSKREAWSHIQAMTETVRQFRLHRGI